MRRRLRVVLAQALVDALGGRRLLAAIAFAMPLCSIGCDSVGLSDIPVLRTIYVSVQSPLVVGVTTRAAAAGEDNHGNRAEIGHVTWSSTAPSVATITQDGLVTGVRAGQTDIVADASGKTGRTTLTVVAASVAAIRVHQTP